VSKKRKHIDGEGVLANGVCISDPALAKTWLETEKVRVEKTESQENKAQRTYELEKTRLANELENTRLANELEKTRLANELELEKTRLANELELEKIRLANAHELAKMQHMRGML
jgi:hypothetical protein